MTDTDGPDPDGLVHRGPVTACRGRIPRVDDVLCLIEVADSRHARGSIDKLAAYAAAGVPQYVIVDLRRRAVEVYAEPDRAAGTYPPPTVVPADGAIPLRVGEAETVALPLTDVLP